MCDSINNNSCITSDLDAITFGAPITKPDDIFVPFSSEFCPCLFIFTDELMSAKSIYETQSLLPYIKFNISEPSTVMKLQTLEEVVVYHTYENRNKWFHKDVPLRVIKSFLKPCIDTENKINVFVEQHEVTHTPIIRYKQYSFLSSTDSDNEIISCNLNQFHHTNLKVDIVATGVRFYKNICEIEFKLMCVFVE